MPKSLLSDKERVRDFQRKLYQKARQEKEFRFYVLYDKVRLPHFLREAYKRCKANKGSSGLDGMSFEDVELYGVDKFLEEIIEELETCSYNPQPVLRVYIPKANGKQRPLGIPVIKDRVVQMAVKLVIEPIFEADFEGCSYGFRPKRSAADAVRSIKEKLREGKTEVFDADLSSYFDTIPHKELMQMIGTRISDKNILHLIKMWLKCPVVEKGKPIGGKKNKIGTPQGGVISPLLTNIYLNLFDKIINSKTNIFYKYQIKIVRYADDWVLMGSQIPEEALCEIKKLLNKLKLSLNEDKSKVVNACNESFDFPGHTFCYNVDMFGSQKKYWNVEPSLKSQKNVREKVRDYLRKRGHFAPQELVNGLNAILSGWSNYFTIKGITYPSKAKRTLRYYLCKKLQRYYTRKSQRKSMLFYQGAFGSLISQYGLIDPTRYAFK